MSPSSRKHHYHTGVLYHIVVVVQSHVFIMFDHLDSFKINSPWASEGVANPPANKSIQIHLPWPQTARGNFGFSQKKNSPYNPPRHQNKTHISPRKFMLWKNEIPFPFWKNGPLFLGSTKPPSSRPKAAAAGRLDLAGGTAGAGIESAMARPI